MNGEPKVLEKRFLNWKKLPCKQRLCRITSPFEQEDFLQTGDISDVVMLMTFPKLTFLPQWPNYTDKMPQMESKYHGCVPLPVFAMVTGGWGSRFGQLGEDMLTPFQQQVIQGNTFFGSARTYYELNDDHSLELGFSTVYSPSSRVPEADEQFLAVSSDDRIDRRTFDVDFHYRWYPLGRGLRQSLSVHGEFLWDFGQGRRTSTGKTKFRKSMGGYVYGEYRLSKRWRPGFRFDWRQLPSEPALVDNASTGLSGSTTSSSGDRTTVTTYSPYITWYPSEFNRFVLQYNNIQHENADDNHQLLLQWQVVIGSHQHGFTERD